MSQKIFSTLAAAWVFYTCVPLPARWPLNFDGIAKVAPLVGILVGAILGGVDTGLALAGMPVLTRSALVVLVWLALTGGLHLDGAMDTADGLAVMEPERRLAVMADSVAGAFGVMVAIALLSLKIVALSELTGDRTLALMAAAGWGRWGQLMAIARYPYLKAEGKGAFHKASIRSSWAALPTGLLLVILGGVQGATAPDLWPRAVLMTFGGGAIALGTGAWFHHKLGGHTGDTYGAVVEWTEALLLALLTLA